MSIQPMLDPYKEAARRKAARDAVLATHHWDSNGATCLVCNVCSDVFHCKPRPCPGALIDGSECADG